MRIDVDVKVEQAAFSEAESDQSIGTDGCGTCVGLLVVYRDLTRVCAHFDCTVVGRRTPDNVTRIQNSVTDLLHERCLAVDVAAAAICSTSNEWTTLAIADAIRAFFSPVALPLQPVMGLYVPRNSTDIKIVRMSDSLSGAVVDNHIATVP